MLNAPEIDKRKGEDVLKRTREIIPFYTPELNAVLEKGAGVALLKIFSNMADVIIHRLNRTPVKNFIAFLDMLGTKLLPPQPARVPVVFVLSEGAKKNTLIPERSQTAAGEIIFETEKTFVATPAKLKKAYSIGKDGIFQAPSNIITGKKPSSFTSKLLYSAETGDENIFLEATDGLEKGDLLKLIDEKEYVTVSDIADAKLTLTDKLKEGHSQGSAVEKITEFELFKGKDLQGHILYLGHKDLFNIKGSAVINLTIPDMLMDKEKVTWEYYGEDEDGKLSWHEMKVSKGNKLIKDMQGEIKELEVNGIKSRWLRCKCLSVIAFKDLMISWINVGSEAGPDIFVGKVQGIGDKYCKILEDRGIDTVEKLLKLKSAELANTLDCNKNRAINILEAARKEYYDKTGLKEGAIASEGHGVLPDALFYNDVPLDPPKLPVYPFGLSPRLNDTFYIASQECFSKAGAKVTLIITGSLKKPSENNQEQDAVPTLCPKLSWEYWDGKGWSIIKGIDEDLTFVENNKPLKPKISVKIEAFPDIKPFTVNGQENLWIRIRLIGGHYGQEAYINDIRGEAKALKGIVTPPVVGNLAISYDVNLRPIGHCLIYNNLGFKDISDECKTGKAFKPFESLDGGHKALYLGFDKKLEKGPISIFFDIKEPESFIEGARLEWEYFADVDGAYQWRRLEVLDGTNALNNSGAAEFVFPDNFIKSKKLGSELYWIRAIYKESEEEECPVIKGIYLNSTWSVQAESIKDELLGASNGEAHQTFSVSRSPVLSSEVWVDEITLLSDGERINITEKKEFESKEVKDEQGNAVEFWVKWTPVDDLLVSLKDERHYEIDNSSGHIRFGDGRHGMVPPIGKDNITANYRTGGGVKGNVGPLEISTLKTSIAFLDKVSNPVPSGGGADIEVIGNALDRGSHYIRNRGRCITEEDYEYIAKEASRNIARSRCIPNMNGERELESGCITVMIIPSTADDRPVPSLQLRTQTATYLREHVAAAVTDNLYVTGPSYLKVSVVAEIIAGKMEDIPLIEKDACSGLRNFLHPLKGGYEGKGWDFGRLPFYSDFYSLLEKIKGVNYVQELSVVLAFEGKDAQEWILSDVEASVSGIHPFMNAVMICSGVHTIRVSPRTETPSEKAIKPKPAALNRPLIKIERGRLLADIMNVIKRK